MQIFIKGKQIDIGDALRTHIEDSLSAAAEKYFSRAVDATVTLSRETSHLYTADISINVGSGLVLSSQGRADEPYPAFDMAADKAAKRLRRYKRRLVDLHHKPDSPTGEAAAKFILEGTDDDAPEDGAEGTEPAVVAELEWRIETLSVADAVMRLDFSDMPALLFRHAGHGELNMIYRRPDGNIGWVDPKGLSR